jgi:TonB family protein
MNRFRAVAIILVAALSGALCGQTTAVSTASLPAVAVVKLFPPFYPPLARQAHITGQVRLSLHLASDGTVNSVELIDGHPMLKQAALDSAEKSVFECGGCGGNGARLRL